MRRHVTHMYSPKENPLYQKKVKSSIPGIISALVGVVLAIYLVYLIVINYSNEFALSQIPQDDCTQKVFVKGE